MPGAPRARRLPLTATSRRRPAGRRPALRPLATTARQTRDRTGTGPRCGAAGASAAGRHTPPGRRRRPAAPAHRAPPAGGRPSALRMLGTATASRRRTGRGCARRRDPEAAAAAAAEGSGVQRPSGPRAAPRAAWVREAAPLARRAGALIACPARRRRGGV